MRKAIKFMLVFKFCKKLIHIKRQLLYVKKPIYVKS